MATKESSKGCADLGYPPRSRLSKWNLRVTMAMTPPAEVALAAIAITVAVVMQAGHMGELLIVAS